jgi:hypothetical protein
MLPTAPWLRWISRMRSRSLLSRLSTDPWLLAPSSNDGWRWRMSAEDEGVAVEAVTAALAGRRISLARVRQALAALEGITVDGGTVRWEG